MVDHSQITSLEPKQDFFFKHVIISCYDTMFCTIFYIPAFQYGSKDYKSKSNSVRSRANVCEQLDKHMSKGTPQQFGLRQIFSFIDCETCAGGKVIDR